MAGTTTHYAIPYPSESDEASQGATKITEGMKRIDEILYAHSFGSFTTSVIATEQSRENTAYGTLATPDEVTIVLPENGLIAVAYQANWTSTKSGDGRAAIFLGASQLKNAALAGGPPYGQEAVAAGTSAAPLFSTGAGLYGKGTGTASEGDVTTGQIVGGAVAAGYEQGGPCYIFAAAGTYKVSVQFKSAEGKVVVKNRKLWAWIVS